jgi:hypothetical protein
MAAMRLRLRLLLLLPLSALLACGSNSPGVALFTTPSGDWVFNVSNALVNAGAFTGSLTIQSTSVSGILSYYNPACMSAPQALAVSGSINSSGTTMTLTTAAFSGSVATLTMQLPLISASVPNYAFGTAVITGGSCALASTQLTANYINYFANFSGTLTGGSITGPLSITVPTSPANSTGQFPISAAGFSFAGSTCNFSSQSLSGSISGYTLTLGNGTVSVNADASSSPIRVTVTGACGSVLTGTMQ